MMRKTFSFIYEHNAWTFGSGLGSLPQTTLKYRYFLEQFIAERNIASVVDFGCGDWQFSRYIYWWEARYTGYDTVPGLIETNRARFAADDVEFLVSPESFTDLKPAELLIVKDVLQHWPDDAVLPFLSAARAIYPTILITNSTSPAERLNTDIRLGQFRPLDLRLPPFSIDAECPLEYSVRCTMPDGTPGDFTKNTLLVTGTQP